MHYFYTPWKYQKTVCIGNEWVKAKYILRLVCFALHILKKTRKNTPEQANLRLFHCRSDVNEVYVKKTISTIFMFFLMIPVFFPSEKGEKLGHDVWELVVSGRLRCAYLKDLKYGNASTLLWIDGGQPNFASLTFNNYHQWRLFSIKTNLFHLNVELKNSSCLN